MKLLSVILLFLPLFTFGVNSVSPLNQLQSCEAQKTTCLSNLGGITFNNYKSALGCANGFNNCVSSLVSSAQQCQINLNTCRADLSHR